MASSPHREEQSHNFYSKPDQGSAETPIVVLEGKDLISLLISAKDGQLPTNQPKLLKGELSQKLSTPLAIDSLNFTRQGKLILTTTSVLTAQELLKIDTLLGVPVTVFIQLETITSRFLLRLDPSIACAEIAEELEEQGIAVHEIRRFVRRSSDSETPTPTVLVTIYGTVLPGDVKLWYEKHRIQPFYDRPRQCAKCLKFNHSTKACRQDHVICKNCATPHSGVCNTPTPVCINCKGSHSADDRNCPAYLRENQLQKLRGDRHLTLREARKQFRTDTAPKTAQYATVAASSTEQFVTRADFTKAIQQISEQFTATVQALASEMERSITAMVESIIAPLTTIIQEMQRKKSSTTNLAALQDILAQRPKKPKRLDDSEDNASLPMDYQSSTSVQSRVSSPGHPSLAGHG